MKTIITALTRLVRDDRGTEATSIALGIVLIALVAGIGMVYLGNELGAFFSNTAQTVKDAGPANDLPSSTIPAAPT